MKFNFHPSGLYLPYQRRPTCIDLFCGCGGFSLGVMQAGFEVVAAVDNDPTAAMTYMHNLGAYPMNIHFGEEKDANNLEKVLRKTFKNKTRKVGEIETFDGIPLSGGGWVKHNPGVPPVRHFFLGDIRKLTGEYILKTIGMERGEVDLIIGGPPCQGFSTAGKRDIMDPRNSLVFEFARLVIEIWPKTFCMENVPGIVSMVTPEGNPVLDEFCRVMEDGGFGTVDSLKRALLANSTAGAALRKNWGNGKPAQKTNKKNEGEKQTDKKKRPNVRCQLSIF